MNKTGHTETETSKLCKSIPSVFLFCFLNANKTFCHLSLAHFKENGQNANRFFWILKEGKKYQNTITTNENLRLIQYKLMTRIYYTRSKINTFDASFSPVWVKCGIYKETIIHASWEGEKVRKGWLEIQKWMTTTSRVKFELTGMRCISKYRYT